MSEQNFFSNPDGLCLSCFSPKGTIAVCPVCGYSSAADTNDEDWNKLKPGTVIHERYVIGRSLGQGGFGITYLGYDLKLKTRLAIKEYYPSGLAARNTASMTVMNATRDTAEDFRQGMDKFLEEARTLARFESHANIVSVRDFFEYNGTAYMVMTYFEGQTMLKYLQSRNGAISFDEAIKLLAPIMDALDEVHASGLIHRDISPDNVFITDTGQVKLLDFGAAKSAMALVNQQSHSIVLKKGYSPAEQYQTKGSLGPWTDIYSMSATIYRSIVGSVPPDSIDRMDEDVLIPPSQQGIAIPDYAEAAIIQALSISYRTRPQSMHDFKTALLGGEAPPIAAPQPQAPQKTAPPIGKTEPPQAKKSPMLLIAAAILVLALAGVGGYMFMSKPKAADTTSAQSVQEEAEQKEDSALDIMRKKAEGGDMTAQYKYAVLFQQGKGVPQDTRIAAEWLRKSAEQGYAPAQNDLGTLYMQGMGVPQDYKEGAKWLTQAADQGNPYAQANLGWLYDMGQGVNENPSKAAELYKAASEKGNATAQSNLAYMYENGRGVNKDLIKAIDLYKKAAEQGVSNAQYSLGLYYEAGAGGLEKSRSKAIQWFKKAADQGDEDAVNKLKSMGVSN